MRISRCCPTRPSSALSALPRPGCEYPAASGTGTPWTPGNIFSGHETLSLSPAPAPRRSSPATRTALLRPPVTDHSQGAPRESPGQGCLPTSHPQRRPSAGGATRTGAAPGQGSLAVLLRRPLSSVLASPSAPPWPEKGEGRTPASQPVRHRLPPQESAKEAQPRLPVSALTAPSLPLRKIASGPGSPAPCWPSNPFFSTPVASPSIFESDSHRTTPDQEKGKEPWRASAYLRVCARPSLPRAALVRDGATPHEEVCAAT